jgi:hypothetical protein
VFGSYPGTGLWEALRVNKLVFTPLSLARRWMGVLIGLQTQRSSNLDLDFGGELTYALPFLARFPTSRLVARGDERPRILTAANDNVLHHSQLGLASCKRFGLTCPKGRLFVQVDSQSEMRPITFLDPSALIGTCAFTSVVPAESSARNELGISLQGCGEIGRYYTSAAISRFLSSCTCNGRWYANVPLPLRTVVDKRTTNRQLCLSRSGVV